MPMRTFLKGLCAGLLLPAAIAGAQQASTVELERRTSEGREVRLSTEVSWDRQCQRQGTPVVTVVAPPASGDIGTRPASKTVQGNLVGSTSCAGMRMEGVGVYYTPRPGFQGIDEVRYDVRFPNGQTLHFVARIDVGAAAR